MLLAPAVIVFVGLAGKHPEKIERQIQPVLAHAHVAKRFIAARELAMLARHTDDSREIVQGLHVDGVVGGALIESGGTLTLRVVIYDGEGNLKSLGETPLGGKAMSKDELEVLSDNLGDELGGIKHKAADLPDVLLPKTPKPSAAPMPAAKIEKRAPIPAATDEINFDSDEVKPAPVDDHREAQHASEASDAVSLADVAALNNGSDAETDSVTATAAATPSDASLHLHADGGFGIASRSFSGPASVMGYSSSPVGTVRAAGGLSPIPHLALQGMAEEALGMSTTIGRTNISTSMSRFEITAAYALPIGSLAIAPTVGYGQRAFSIASSATDRSPDTSYGYMILGATAALPIGERLTLRGLAAFEPVTGGDDPTAMAFGAATRWAFDAGAGLDLELFSHVTARAAVDYQRFSWAWNAAGARGAGGAVDSYPTGTLSLGAEY